MTGYVYAIAAGDLVKIGYSVDPTRRLNKIKADNGSPCRLLGIVPGTLAHEAELLALLRPWRARGSWFYRGPRAVEFFISSLRPLIRPVEVPTRAMGKVRRLLRLTQAQMAILTGASQASVSRWEAGLLEPSLAQLEAIRGEARKRAIAWDDSWFFERPAEQVAAQ